MVRTADVAVVGGGVVGLAVARAVLLRRPGLRVVVLEKEPVLGAHASGRNSGVLHAGFYYSPDSAKAALTARGNRLLTEFCAANGVPVRRCGKVVVATSERDLPGLLELHRRGRSNGVAVELLDEAALREAEPLARTTGQALWSPTTGVADPGLVLAALAREVRRLGATVLLGSTVAGGGPGNLDVAGGPLQVGHVINCAGLYADVVAGWFGFCDDYAMLPFKGMYWQLDWPAGLLRRHVYPVPDCRNPFLGVHFTATPGGGAKIGPTATPSLRREDYGRLRGRDGREAAAVLRLWPQVLASPHHDGWQLVRSEAPKYSRRVLAARARALVPSLQDRHVRVRVRPGVRAQLWSLYQRRMEMDFVVRGDARSTHLLNIVSPGWTASLAVAEQVVEELCTSGTL